MQLFEIWLRETARCGRKQLREATTCLRLFEGRELGLNSNLPTLRSELTHLLGMLWRIAASARALAAPLTGCWHMRGGGARGVGGPARALRTPLSVAFLELISPECRCCGVERRPGRRMLQRRSLCAAPLMSENRLESVHVHHSGLRSCLNVTPVPTEPKLNQTNVLFGLTGASVRLLAVM